MLVRSGYASAVGGLRDGGAARVHLDLIEVFYYLYFWRDHERQLGEPVRRHPSFQGYMEPENNNPTWADRIFSSVGEVERSQREFWQEQEMENNARACRSTVVLRNNAAGSSPAALRADGPVLLGT